MKRIKILPLLFALLGAAVFVAGHDTYLVARRAAATPGAVVTLDLTSGMRFPALDHAIKPERVERARGRLGGRTFDLTGLRPAPKSLRFDAPLGQTGVATLWVELKPRTLELTPKQVAEYLDEIGAPEDARRAWAEAKRPRRWRETYTKHAKTFVRVGEAAGDRSWAGPVGMALEVVPERDPTALSAGDELPVVVLKGGAPLAGFAVGLVHETGAHELSKTDAAGRVTFRLARAGRWLLRGTELRKPGTPDGEWESHFTTLAVNVSTARRASRP
jgi:hypothetical protein